MSACIICGGSAGLLYSLHKQCYEHYQHILEYFPGQILEELGQDSPQTVHQNFLIELDKTSWQPRARTDLIQRVLERAAQQLLRKPQEENRRSLKLIELIQSCDFDDLSSNYDWLLQRLENLPLVSQLLSGGPLPLADETIVGEIPFKLDEGERLVWMFPMVNSGFRSPKPLELPRSSLEKVFEMLMAKRHPQPLETRSTGTGEIWLSTTRMEYLFDKGRETVFLNDIMSVTPIPNGVRIEQKMSDSVARDYLCGDGLLMHTLLMRVLKGA